VANSAIFPRHGILFLTIVLFLLPYTYTALLPKMCRIGNFKGVGHC